MKHSHTHRPSAYRSVSCPAYPGAADPSYFLGRAGEVLAAIGTGAGIISLMVFLVILA